MRRRSLTLIETLIALALVLAIAALIFPSMLKSMEERTFESAADLTNEQLMMARAHAQATGAPVEVTYSVETSQVQARFFTPWLLDPNMGLTPPAGPTGRGDAEPDEKQGGLDDADSASGRDGQSDDALIGESWACRDLGRGVRFVISPPASSEPHDGSAETADMGGASLDAALSELGKGQDVRLAVFMPDGSALVGDPVYLNDDKGRRGLLTINPWSGLPVFQRLVDEDEAGTAAGAAEDSAKELKSVESRDERRNRSGSKPNDRDSAGHDWPGADDPAGDL